MLTMNSRSANASASWLEFGVDSIGLPPTVTSAADLTRARGEDLLGEDGRPGTRPAPRGGRSPASARDRSGTRVRCRARRGSSDRRRRASRTSHPPGRSRLPVNTLTTSMSHEAVGPELGRGRADPAVHRGRRGGGELACEPADRRRIDAGRGRDRLGRERDHCGTDIVETGEVRRDVRARIGETFVEQRVARSRPASSASDAGADREPLVGLLGGAAAPRIDDHELAARSPASPRSAPGSRARCTGCRSTRTDWRRARRGSRCGRGRAPGPRRAFRTRTRRRRGGASGRPSTRCSAAVCRAPVSSGPGEHHRREAVRRRVAEVHGERLAAVPLDHAAETVARRPPTPRPTTPRRARRRA